MNQAPGRFDYFMLRLARGPEPGGSIAGLAERLWTGEKRSFGSGEQLLQLIGEWSPRGSASSPHSYKEGGMNPMKPAGNEKAIDLEPRVIRPETAEQVRGGRAGGDDDDLEELQVERKIKPKK